VIVGYNNHLTFYWVLILAPFVLVGLIAAIRKQRKRKKEANAWLKDSITRDGD
jgi:preprotein translocase subunit YajC